MSRVLGVLRQFGMPTLYPVWHQELAAEMEGSMLLMF